MSKREMKIRRCVDCPLFDEEFLICKHPDFDCYTSEMDRFNGLNKTIYYNCPLFLGDLKISVPVISVEKFSAYLESNGWKKRMAAYSPSNGNYFCRTLRSRGGEREEFIFLPSKHNEFTHNRFIKAIEKLNEIDGFPTATIMENVLEGVLLE